MKPGLPQVIEALALRAEKAGQPQPVPARLLRDVAEALADLGHIAGYGCPWCQRVAREGRQATPGPALAAGESPRP